MCALFMWLYVTICVTEWVEIWLGMDWDVSNDGFVAVWWCFWVSVRVTECGYPVSQYKSSAGRRVGVGSFFVSVFLGSLLAVQWYFGGF